MDLKVVIISFLGISIFILLLSLEDLRKLYRNHNMYVKIGWIAEKEKSTVAYKDASLRSEDLIYYIMQQQIELNIPKQYSIDVLNENERKNVEEILNFHKNKVVESYFHDILSKSRKICKLNSLEYYFFSLYCFLYKEIDKGHSSFKWSLNDNGRAYFKLYLITNMFIESNEKTKKLFEYINPNIKAMTMEHIEKINSHLEERKKHYGTDNL